MRIKFLIPAKLYHHVPGFYGCYGWIGIVRKNGNDRVIIAGYGFWKTIKQIIKYR